MKKNTESSFKYLFFKSNGLDAIKSPSEEAPLPPEGGPNIPWNYGIVMVDGGTLVLQKQGDGGLQWGGELLPACACGSF